MLKKTREIEERIFELEKMIQQAKYENSNLKCQIKNIRKYLGIRTDILSELLKYNNIMERRINEDEKY